MISCVVVVIVAVVLVIPIALEVVIEARSQAELGKGQVLLDEVGRRGAHVAKEQLDTMQKLHFQM